MRWHPTPVLGHTNRGLSCTEIPPRTMCGSGLSPDHADSLSHRLAYVRRSCRRNSCRSVAVAGAQKSSLGENHGTGLAVSPPNAVSLLPEPLLKKISSPVKPEHWRYHTHHGTESGHETVPEEHSSPIQRRTLPSHIFPPVYAWSIGHEWGGVRWAAAPPGAAGASVCPQSEAEPSGGANRLVMRRRTPLRQIESRSLSLATISRSRLIVESPHYSTTSQTKVFHPQTRPPQHTPYFWGISHAKWNLLRRIEHGNTSSAPIRVASALRTGHKIAVWWQEPDPANSRWFIAKILESKVEKGVLEHKVLYNSDKSRTWTHRLMPRSHQIATGNSSRWAPAPPTFTPPCPGCGGSTRGGTGASIGRLSYTCDQCVSKCTSRDPATLARADPGNPRITEDPETRPTQARAMRQAPAAPAQGTRKSPRLATLAPDAGGQPAAAGQMANAGAHAPPAPPPRPLLYRSDTDQRQCVADTILTYHNTNSLGAPGAGKGYLRDVALTTSDVHAISETSWDEAQIKVLTGAMKAGGHRLWAVAAKTRSTVKSGTAILARSTISPREGDGLLWGKPDGKALAVALTIQDQPVVLLAAHLPHTDPERIAFLNEVADEVERAATAHSQTPEGAPWATALYLWAGDLNLTCHRTLDNETPKPTPSPEVTAALNRLNQVMGGAIDVYRALHPTGRAYTHGTVEKGVTKPGSRRRLDAWMAPPGALSGPTGIVAARLLDKERTGFSYVDSHTRKEIYRESDHDGVQIVLRGALIPKPEPRATLRPNTLGDPGVRAAISSLLAETTDLTTGTADTLWNRVLSIGLEHQRKRAKARGARRQEILKKIKRLQDKLKGMPESRRYRRVTYTLNRYKGKLRLQIHKDRRRRDDQEEYTAQMVAKGQGKQPKPWAPPQPVTRVQEPATHATCM